MGLPTIGAIAGLPAWLGFAFAVLISDFAQQCYPLRLLAQRTRSPRAAGGSSDQGPRTLASGEEE